MPVNFAVTVTCATSDCPRLRFCQLTDINAHYEFCTLLCFVNRLSGKIYPVQCGSQTYSGVAKKVRYVHTHPLTRKYGNFSCVIYQ